MKPSLSIVLALLLVGCGGGGGDNNAPPVNNPPSAGPTPAEQFAADLSGLTLSEYYDTSLEVLLRRAPETNIWRSLHEIYPQAQPGLDNLSDDFRRETFAMYQVALDAFRTYDRSVLDAAGQLNYDTYEWYLQDIVDSEPFIYHGFAATYGLFGIPKETEQLFTEVHPLQTLQDAEDYIARLNRVGSKFTQLVQHLQLQRQAGIVEPARTMQFAINQVQAMAQGSTASNPYYTNFVTGIASIPGISSEQRADLDDRAFTAVNGVVKVAYQQLLQSLQGLLNNAPPSIGVGQYPQGSEYYSYLLRHHTTTDMTAAEIHQLGLDELVRIHSEIRLIFDQLGYPQNETLQQLFARAAAGGGIIPAANVKSTYEAIIDVAKQDVGDAFDIFPSADVVVIGVPFGGFYIGPSADGSRPGAFYAGTQNDEPWFQMRSVAYHEAIPGHHTQIAIGLDQNMPVAREVARSTGFIEGWALYAERLALELGWHDNDPYSNLGRLQYEALRAARLVVDTGIHNLGWTFYESRDFIVANIGETPEVAEASAARYSVYPGQATAYMVGMLQILSERQRAMDALGAQFDIKDFHRALLTNGALPLAFMDTIVDQYIAETLAAP